MNRAAAYAIPIILSAGLLVACGSGSAKVAEPEPVPAEPDAVEEEELLGIQFEIEPPDAEVIVDGEFVGSAADVIAAGTLELSAGLHQIMIRHEDYETYRVEVTIGDKPEGLQINLQAKEQ